MAMLFALRLYLNVCFVSTALLAAAEPTLYLCGDSTMAQGGAHNGVTDGWGQYIAPYLRDIKVVNAAAGGRSARSFWDQGRFAAVAASLNPGDVVLVQFGHNDGSNPTYHDNSRSDCHGEGDETCISDTTGAIVHTFSYYISNAVKLMLAKGANVILSSQTPNNPWEGHVWSFAPTAYVGYQKKIAESFSAGVSFVDHFRAVDNAYYSLGDQATNACFPKDHTHTSPACAKLVAQAFAEAIATAMNGTTPLASHVASKCLTAK